MKMCYSMWLAVGGTVFVLGAGMMIIESKDGTGLLFRHRLGFGVYYALTTVLGDCAALHP